METTPGLNVTSITKELITSRAYNKPFSDASIIASACILLPLMVLGIIGNLLTIIAISTSPLLKSVFNQFILSLCVSDLISALISPLFLYRRTWGYDEWKIPSFFCKLYWATDMFTSYVTAQHILLFAILRLISIRWPHIYGKITSRHAKITVFVVWAVAFLVGFIPFAIWYDAGIRRRNTDDIDAKWPACTLIPKWVSAYSLYQNIVFPLFFYVPTIAIIILTVLIGVLLWLRRRDRSTKLQRQMPTGTESKLKKSAHKEKEAMLQLGMIAGSFMLGYLPFTAYEISSLNSTSNTDATEEFWWAFGMAEYICLRISETLNPVFYNLASQKLRKVTINVVTSMFALCFGCCCKDRKTPDRPPIPSMSATENKGLPRLNTTACVNPALEME